MKKIKKKYKRPQKMWNKERIEADKELIKEFGLKKKREIWKAETLLRKYRGLARRLAAKKNERVEKELIEKLARFGILKKGSGLDDVLSMSVNDILGRRLQTIVTRKGLANTPNQARQLIVHGHVTIDGRKIVYPSYMVALEEESKIKVRLAKAAPVKK